MCDYNVHVFYVICMCPYVIMSAKIPYCGLGGWLSESNACCRRVGQVNIGSWAQLCVPAVPELGGKLVDP